MEKLFENALSEQTYKYIQTQQQLFQKEDNISQLDLRVLCSQVSNELEQVQKDSALDYLSVEKEILQLNTDINTTDQVLEELEIMLTDFQDNLDIIKDDMTSLQQRSFNMNVSLQNRKNLSSKITEFIDNAVLEPELISDICNKEIDENYIDYIQKLNGKLKYINENKEQYGLSQIVEGLEPELIKLNKKACQRVRDFLIDKINLLKKPKTNICIVQGSVLVKYSVFSAYLKEHFPIVFIETCNLYAETVSRIYQNNYKIYSTELIRFTQYKYQKNDILISDNNQNNFELENRDQILNNIDEMPIICQVAKQNNQKYNLEEIFKSLNKFLLDSVQGEFNFTLQFFGLRADQNTIFFGGVLKQTMSLALETLKNMFSQSYDIFSILLITLLNNKYKESNLQKSNNNVFDFYFEQISIQIWPRFEQIFDLHLQSIKNVTVNQIKNYEKNQGIRNFHQRIINFCAGLQKIYKLSDDTNKMLYSRIIIIKNVYFDLIRKVSKDMQETQKFIYLIQIFDLIQQNFINEFLEGQLETEINGYIDRLVDLYLQEYFQHLVDFIKKYCQDLLQNQENEQQIQETQSVNFSLIENIGQQLNESWNRRVEEIRKELDKNFKDTQILNIIVKKFLSQLLAYYNTFFKYVKSNHEQFSQQLMPVHIFMKDIKGILKVYFK